MDGNGETQSAEIGLGGSTARMAGCTACGTQRWYHSEGRLYRSCRDSTQHETGRDFVAEMDDFGAKIGWISWMRRGETWGNARST